jgi:hypothetical protein
LTFKPISPLPIDVKQVIHVIKQKLAFPMLWVEQMAIFNPKQTVEKINCLRDK